MTTLAPSGLKTLARKIEDVPDLPSAVNSGIVGDVAHERRGYHTSIEDLRDPNDYSNRRPNDKAPPGNWPRNLAAAVDTSMSTADMIKTWDRVYAVWANHNDPRRKYWNAFNGWNGKGSAERLDFVANTRTVATDDHKWHDHDETPRRYVNDPEMVRAKASVYAGETIAQYMGTTTTGDEMAKVLVADTSGAVWLCSGDWRRYIGQEGSAAVAGYSPSQAGSPGLLGPFGNGGNVAKYNTPPSEMNAWGKDVDASPFTPAVIAAIAAAMAQQVIAADTNELTVADLEAVTAAARTGVENAVVNLQFTTETHAIVIPEDSDGA